MAFAAWPKKKSYSANAIYIDIDIPNGVAWIDLGADPDFPTVCNPGFGDVRITLPDETTELPRYITPCGVCYIGMPLTAATDQEVVIFCGNAAATDYAPTDPFGQYSVMPAEYWKTFHEDTPAGSFPANDEANGTPNYNGTAVNLSSKLTLLGPVKYCWDFRNTVVGAGNADRIEQGTNGVDFSAGPPFSISCWTTIVNTGAPSSSILQCIIADYQSFSGQRGYYFGYHNGLGGFIWNSWDVGGSSTGNLQNASNLSGEPNQTWHHIAFTMDAAGNWKFYLDGLLDGSGTVTPRNFNSNCPEVTIGSSYRSSVQYDLNHAGYMADLRCFESTVLTPEWIKAEYNNSQAGNFWIIGPLEDNGVTPPPAPVFPDGTKWGFTLNDSVIEPETVQGWDSLSAEYTFDGNFIRTPNSGELTFCGGTAYDAILSLDPCQNHSMELFYDCGDGPISFAKYQVSQRDITFNCEECSASITLNDGNLLQTMEKNGSQETCWSPDSAIELITGEPPSTASEKNGPFQVVSGGDLERSIPNRSVLSLLNLMVDRQVPGATVTGNLLTTPFLPEIHEIVIPGAYDNTGGGAVLRLETMFGAVYEVGCADGTPVPADAYAQALMYVEAGPGATIDMSVDEITTRITEAISNGVDTIEIRADFSFSCELLDATSAVVATSTVVQNFQYGLKGLALTPKAITDPNICVSWEDLTTALIALGAPIIRDGSETIDISDATGLLSSGGVAAGSEIGERERSFDDRWLVSEYNISQEASIDDFEASQAAWIWRGDLQPIRLSSDTNFGAIVTWTYGGAQPTMFSISGGSFTSFVFPVPTNLLIASIELEINGTGTGWSYLATLPASGTLAVQDITTTPEWEAPEPVCLNPGDIVSLRIRPVGSPLVAGTNLAVAFDMVLALNIPCFDAPNFDQDASDDLQFVLTETACCAQQDQSKLTSAIDAGIGYALTEQLTGLHNYKDTHFLIMTDPDDPTDPLAFSRRFFFSIADPNINADCPCYADSEQVFFYYNILLQRLHTMHRQRAIVPTGYTWDAFRFQAFTELNGDTRGGTASTPGDAVTVESTDVNAGLGYYGWDVFTFTKCIDVQTFLDYKEGGLLNIEDDCICEDISTIKTLTFTPNLSGSVNAQMSVLMKCTELDNSCEDDQTDLVRGVTTNDSDLSITRITTTGSLDGAVDISLDPLAQYTDKLCLTDKNLNLETIREVELLEIEYHYDGANTIIDSITVNPLILPADAAAIQALITPLAGQCGYQYDKEAIDTRLKGYDFVANLNYGYTENALGFNYYVLYFGWPFLLDADGTPLDDGAYHRIKGTVTYNAETSSQAAGEIRRTIKRMKNSAAHLDPTASAGHAGTELRYTYTLGYTQPDASHPVAITQPVLGSTNWWDWVNGQALIDDADGTGTNAIVSTAPVIKAGYAAGTYQLDMSAVTLNGMSCKFKAAYYADPGVVLNNQIHYGYVSAAAVFNSGPINCLFTWIGFQAPGPSPETIGASNVELRDDQSDDVIFQQSQTSGGWVSFRQLAVRDPYVLQKWTSKIEAVTTDGFDIEQTCKVYIAETY